MTGNSFMTRLIDLLDDDMFMRDVARPVTKRVDVQYFLSIVENVLDQVTALAGNTQPKGEQGQSKSSNFLPKEISDDLPSTIGKLCCQITCAALQTCDVKETMAALLKKLSPFPWDAKAVLTLSAFTVYYAENCRLAQLEGSDDLLSLTARLRGFRAIGNSSNAFVKLNDLIKETLEFTKYVVEHVKPYSSSADELALFKYIILTVLGCSVQFSGLISASNEFEGLDLSTFSDKVKMKYDSVKKEFSYEEIKRRSIYCANIVELMEVLVCTKDGPYEIYQCPTSTPVEVEKELENKSVLLLISDLNLSDDDREILTNIYDGEKFQPRNYEIMWVPIVDDPDSGEMQKQFEEKRSKMKWYTCKSLVSKSAAKFIRRKWQFRQETKVVVLNQQGKVVNMNAMTMIRLFRADAFPFTESEGKDLWISRGINWLKLVFPVVEQSILDEGLIILYGSAEDTQTVQNIEKNLKLIEKYLASCKLLNVSSKKERFLTDLECCLSLKMLATSDVYDPQAQELLKLYTNYKQRGGFAVIARGSTVVVNIRLADFEAVLSDHPKWTGSISNTETIEKVIKGHYEQVVAKRAKTKCHRFSIPKMVGNIPECIRCPECRLYLKGDVTFECCHGEH